MIQEFFSCIIWWILHTLNGVLGGSWSDLVAIKNRDPKRRTPSPSACQNQIARALCIFVLRVLLILDFWFLMLINKYSAFFWLLSGGLIWPKCLQNWTSKSTRHETKLISKGARVSTHASMLTGNLIESKIPINLFSKRSLINFYMCVTH